MARTYHHDYTRKDGSIVTVEYTFKEGSEPTGTRIKPEH